VLFSSFLGRFHAAARSSCYPSVLLLPFRCDKCLGVQLLPLIDPVTPRARAGRVSHTHFTLSLSLSFCEMKKSKQCQQVFRVLKTAHCRVAKFALSHIPLFLLFNSNVYSSSSCAYFRVIFGSWKRLGAGGSNPVLKCSGLLD